MHRSLVWSGTLHRMWPTQRWSRDFHPGSLCYTCQPARTRPVNEWPWIFHADTSDVNYVSDVNSDVFLSSTWVSDGCFLWMNLVFALHGASREADTSTAPEITNVASIFGRGGPLFNTDAYFYSFAEYFWAYWFLSSILFFFFLKKTGKQQAVLSPWAVSLILTDCCTPGAGTLPGSVLLN